ncbi:hypothetical protein J437_LFUL007214 [Ladona fulva]|uniref:Glutathione peroxidase n=1 Tax=Ladona fulva TaxID=123851 RepID=A0A8K0K5T2_LADFU|nr:hypothetical protein J437_LFUL007214 [Ladona fulva]
MKTDTEKREGVRYAKMAVGKPWFASLLCVLAVGLGGAEAANPERVMSRHCQAYNRNSPKMPRNGIYDFTVPDIYGDRNISLSEFRGKQEPGANASEILNGIRHVRPGNGFRPKFPLTAKLDVNGEKEHPLFTFLKSLCPSTREYFSDKNRLFYDKMKNSDIRWNWEKFLINREGIPIVRYDASTEPHFIEVDIEDMMRETNA